MTAYISSLTVALVLAGTPATPQDPSLNSQAIVQELRALREAVEQVLASQVRVQLLMGRLQLQESRVQTLIRQSREIDTQVASMAAERESLLQERRRMERAMNETADPAEREFVKEQHAALGERLKQLENRHSTLLADQANAQQLLVNEQSRWDEFNVRLEELERMLGSVKR